MTARSTVAAKTLTDALAALPPVRGNPKALGPRLEAAGLAEQVLQARRDGVSFNRIVRGLRELGIVVTPNPVNNFCRANGVD